MVVESNLKLARPGDEGGKEEYHALLWFDEDEDEQGQPRLMKVRLKIVHFHFPPVFPSYLVGGGGGGGVVSCSPSCLVGEGASGFQPRLFSLLGCGRG